MQPSQKTFYTVANVALVRRIRDNEGKLVPAKTSRDRVVAKYFICHLRDLPQYLVSTYMPQRIVHLFEIIHIEQQHRADRTVPVKPLQNSQGFCFESFAGIKARQGIPLGIFEQPVVLELLFLLTVDIFRNAEYAHGLAVLLLDHRACQAEPTVLAVLA